MTRRSKREQLFKLLFRVEFNELCDMDAQAQRFFENRDHAIDDDGEDQTGAAQKENDINEIKDELEKIISLLPEIDNKISEKVTGWDIARIGKVELTLIRLAAYEIDYEEDVPTSVAINEAVELSKKYGQDDAGSFVNGVLAKLTK